MNQRYMFLRLLGIAVLAGSAVLATGVLAMPLNSVTFTVTSLDDSGPGSLREAIDSANASPGADAVSFEVDGTILLESTLPNVTDDLSIDGTGHSIIVDGNGSYQIIEVSLGVSLSLTEIELDNGYGLPEGSSEGGAIRTLAAGCAGLPVLWKLCQHWGSDL